ncbi:PREDICTED: receptor-like protein 12 [Populus euphratica]|uniref:Receptor-like protein 12 n=1 Tax=Populus euphratica TaxID=75702 RepID=A0AAJ6VA12_POPEU|nr:PREDICTED: receptor-like protein 12 [Populus euphratica]
MMGSSLLLAQFICLLLFHSHSQPTHSSSNISSSVQLCPGDQSLALLQFKNSFPMPSSPYRFSCYPPKKVLWKEGTDCCSWDGVTCNMKTGHVIGLDLGCSMLYGTLHSNSTLFSLHHLQKLDLSRNDFNRSVISSSFGRFLHLTHLNLNSSNFAGQVPPEISHLSRLVSLGLSSNSEELMLEPISFNKLAQNLTQLRELYLGGVNMSLVVPSSLMNLSSSLSSLQLWRCGLKGELPDNLFRRSNLQWLDLWSNEGLTGSFPKYNLSTALSHLDLSYTRISIHLEPDSISHLKSVEKMYLSGCNFVGSNLDLLGNLTQLIELGLAGNQFGGQIPFSLGKLKQLKYLHLGNNSFMGPIPDSLFKLTQLEWLDLSYNRLIGLIPFQISMLSNLTALLLSNNQLIGRIPSQISRLSSLIIVDLSHNLLNGTIPSSLFSMPSLHFLLLFSCYPPKKVLWKEGTDCCSWDGVTCNMKTGHVIGLDLGCSMLYGTLHSNSTLFSLHHLQKLDLYRNDFNRSVISSSFGQFLRLTHLNLNSSNFAGQVPPKISHLSRLVSLDLSSNSEELMLEPISFNKLAQNLTQLSELYLGGVNMSLVVPSSLMNLSSSLSTLQLWRCGLKGELPDNLFRRSNLQWLDLWSNEELTGSFPPYNLSNALSHLDLSYTRISIHLEPDSISHLKSVEKMYLSGCNFVGSNLDLLGNLTQLIELGLADNSLSGPLPTEYFNNFKAMMSIDQDMDYMRTKNVSTTYVFSVQLAWKGSKTVFPKIQIALTTLDLSCNKFTGKIPESLGKLKSLKQLNLSHNSLIGGIQPSLGNLTNLESLDLSSNLLAGRIPQELVALTFLQVLNLSYNQLEGPIPLGKQFNTFEKGSFEGNVGLCGFPLQVKCNKDEGQQPPPSNFEKEDSMFEEGFGWQAVAMGYGCGFVFGVSIGYVVFRARKAAWFVKMVEDSAHQYGKRLRRENAPRNGGRRY